MRFVFVGERRSPTAVARGWTWESGRLCADTLHRALAAAGLDPTERSRVRFINLFVERDTGLALSHKAITAIRTAHRRGWTVVGMGRRVRSGLDHVGIPHRSLIHPAARGAIRKTARYQAHVAAVLTAAPSYDEVTR